MRRTQAVTAVLCFIALASSFSTAQDREDITEFLRLCDEWVPDRGSLVLTYRTVRSDRVGLSTIGLDFASGAWFVASGSRFLGQTPTGQGYVGQPEVEHAQFKDEPPPYGIANVCGYIPSACLLSFLRNPDSILKAEQNEQHGWIVQFVVSNTPAMDGQRTATLEVGNDGRPIRLVTTVPSEPDRVTVFHYASDASTFVPVCSGAWAGDRQVNQLEHVEAWVNGKADVFEPENVELLAVDNRRAEQLQLAHLAAQKRASGGSDARSPYSGSGLFKSRWPLIGTGLVAIVVGLFVIFRTRAAR